MKFYQGSPWRKLARVAKARDGFLCVHCRREGRTGAAQVVHHKKAINDGGAKLQLENLESICRECHESHHHRFAENAMSLTTIEGRAQSNNNGPSI